MPCSKRPLGIKGVVRVAAVTTVAAAGVTAAYFTPALGTSVTRIVEASSAHTATPEAAREVADVKKGQVLFEVASNYKSVSQRKGTVTPRISQARQ
jgi:hypothetical protein